MTTSEDLIKIIARITHANAAELFPTTLLKDIKADSLHWVQIIVNCREPIRGRNRYGKDEILPDYRRPRHLY